MNTRLDKPSEPTLRATPARVVTFLLAIATRPPIRAAMQQAGYTNADHAEGWRLLRRTGEIREGAIRADAASRAAKAMNEIQAWVNADFRRFHAATERLHPTWVGLFPEVDSRSPADAVLLLAKLIEQVTHGDASRDAAFLATLAQRGLDTIEVERLTRLLTAAQGVDLNSSETNAGPDDRTPERLTLYHWHRDWVESAKQVIKRKDYRAQLGIGREGQGQGQGR
jgi:hypothetical protein